MSENNKNKPFTDVGLWSSRKGGYSAVVTSDVLTRLKAAIAGAKEGDVLYVGPNTKKEEGSKQPDFRMSIFAPKNEAASQQEDSI